MARGGARVGSGRKPKAVQALVEAKATPFALVDGGKAASGVSLIPPDDLLEGERDFWHRYAARAIEQGTLTVDTIAGFRLLCNLDAKMRKRAATIERDGETYLKVVVDGSGQEHQELKAHPLIGPHDRIAKQVEALMARYKIAAFGKPEARKATKVAANPWSQLAR